ncbi:MAG: peptide chain release factor N(5)-glutamine methyltransferase [Paracoccaceae bacterium]
MRTVGAALREGAARLRASGVAEAGGDARRLMAFALGIAPERLLLAERDPLAAGAAERWEKALAERAARRPVAQILGRRLFMGRVFRVTADTLDPRPETEVLVAEALSGPLTRMLDLGTGTGCVLLSCLAERRGATGVGSDISPAALDVARGNAEALGLRNRAAFAQADWFEGVAGEFDLIVSNPPYVAEAEMAGLAAEVRDWEPRLALTPGGDGLGAYRAIASGAAGHLSPGGRLAVEIGWRQAGAVRGLLGAAGFRDIRVASDLDGRDRVVAAARP